MADDKRQNKDSNGEPAGCGLKRIGFFWPGKYFRKACRRHDSLQEILDAEMGWSINMTPKKADKEFLKYALAEAKDSSVLQAHAWAGYYLLRAYSVWKYKTFR